jgi:DNA-binding LacI/PurR family transcriptional regulator/AraC-like DNA-binding protein
MEKSKGQRTRWLAQKKRTGKRITIGFTGVTNFRSFIGKEYLAGVSKAAQDYDINLFNFLGLIKYSLLDDIDFLRHYLKKFQFMKPPVIDGLVTWASSLMLITDKDTVSSVFSKLQPLPMVDVGYTLVSGIPSVRINNEPPISALMKHLIIDHNYTRFAFIGNSDVSPHIQRMSMWRKELEKYKIPILEDAIFFTPTMGGREIALCVEQLCSRFDLHNKTDIDAIIIPSDIVAQSITDELRKRGFSIPNDVAVTGYNNQYEGMTSHPPLTTIDPDFFNRGYRAVELLIDYIMDPSSPPQDCLLEPRLIIRQSCGCYENTIKVAGNEVIIPSSTNILDADLKKALQPFFEDSQNSHLESIIEGIHHDLHNPNAPSELLQKFQIFLHDPKIPFDHTMGYYNQIISAIRNALLPTLKNDITLLIRIENILHQLRVMISLLDEYRLFSQPGSADPLTRKTHVAMSLASSLDMKQFKDMLKYQMSELAIPGMLLALEENMTPDLETLFLDFVHPEPFISVTEELPVKIQESTFIPRKFFPYDRRYTMMFEILQHSGQYLGIALLELGQTDPSWIDTVRVLFSQTLYAIYMREGRISSQRTLLSTAEVEDILAREMPLSPKPGSGKICAQDIVSYLLDHLNEMTNLDKMADEMGISKPHLIRQAKIFTGFSIRTLHEQLKIEQAKKLLQAKNCKLAEIAQRLGFQNQSYFSAVFKKVTGSSPREWLQ